jgi:GWxTD domain-containing protein
MKTSLFTLLFIVLTSFAFGKDRELRAYLDSKQFFAPGVGNYVEFHLQFDGKSVNYHGQDDGLMGELAVIMEIKRDGAVVASDAYRLNTPLMKDSIVEDFYDLKRFVLDPGMYSLHIVLQDLNSDNDPLENSVSFLIDDLSDAIALSDIQVAEAGSRGDGSSPFYKSGYDIIPRLSTFYPEQLNTIPVYFEIYNSRQLEDSVFGIRQTVINADKNTEVPELTVFTRHYAGEVVPILKKIDISSLPTGRYIVSYTILNRNMLELSTTSYEFERSNDFETGLFTDEIVLDPAFQNSIPQDSLGYFLEALIPISKTAEVKNIFAIAKAKNEEQARRYIQQYWTRTTPQNPYEGWMAYRAQVLLVERLYGNNFQEGFETDRGRVYLQYGAPTNIIIKDYSPTEYPYEIWQYNKIGAFSNKRFIFYNPDLVNNAHRLLHSDMVGELKNPAWPRELAKRNTTNGNVDDPNRDVQDHWGGNANELFRQY